MGLLLHRRFGILGCAAALLATALLSGCPVSNVAKVTFAAAPTRGYAPLQVEFHASVEALPPYVLEEKFRGDGLPMLRVISYSWTFGDGGTGQGSDPVHTYTKPGKYLVTLRGLVLELPTNTLSMTAPFYGSITVLNPNAPPVANAGADQTLHFGNPATLDGSASSDPDGDPITYLWSFVSRPEQSAAELDNATVAGPVFTADLPGDYVLQLIVNDGQVDSAPDTVTITAANTAPLANAGPDQNPVLGEETTLDGSDSSDPDDDPITYLWTIIERPELSEAVLDNPSAMAPVLVPDRPGNYTLQLVVNDGHAGSAPDTVLIVVSVVFPTINTSMGTGTEFERTIECGDPFVPPEFSAVDGLGNDITGEVVVGGDTVDTGTIGVYVVTYNVSDIYGNAAPTVTLTVTVEDTIPPIALTRDIAVNLDENGLAAITPEAVDAGSSDSCGLSLAVSPNQFTCENLGPNTVTLTATDAAGHSTTATAVVSVNDTLAPSAVAQNLTIQLNEEGAAAITPEDIDAGSTDNCSVLLEVTPSVFSCEDVGTPVTVTLTASDPSGNANTALAEITVLDTIAPEALAQDITVQLDTNGQASITAEDIDAGSNDRCGVALTVSPYTFSCNDLALEGKAANISVVLTATDPSGNVSTAVATVTVSDDIAPEALAQNITVQLDSNGQAAIRPEEVDAGSRDNCGISMAVSPNAFSCDDLAGGQEKSADIPVTLTVSDSSGNQSTALATVTVVDSTAPVALARNATVQLNALGRASIVAEDVDGGSSDNCAFSLAVSPSAFDCEDISGPVTVTLTATDSSGNTDTDTALVTVQDLVAPEVLAQDVTVQLDGNGQASILAAAVDAGSSDNCSVSLSVQPDSFTCDDVAAPVAVTLTGEDPSGNIATATAQVTVLDTIAPTALAQDVTVQLDEWGEAYVIPENVDAGSSDNCNFSLSVYPYVFTCFDAWKRTDADPSHLDDNLGGEVGPDPVILPWEESVTLTITDSSGNTSTALASVTIVDHIMPTVVAQDLTVQLDAQGAADIEPYELVAEIDDNCQVFVFANPLEFSCEDTASPVQVTLTVMDYGPDSVTATALVTVEDNIAPIARAQDITVYLDAQGQAVIDPAAVDAGNSDNCSVALSVFPNIVTCDDVNNPEKTAQITLTATDPSGNTATATAQVTVVDDIAPTALAQDVTVQLDAQGQASITAEAVDDGSSDNCGVILSVDPSTFDCGLGEKNYEQTVTLTVTDPSGNTATATALVSVVDTIAPAALAQDVTVQLDAQGQASVAAEAVDNGSSDNCAVMLEVAPAAFTCADTESPVPVILTVSDPNGNTSTATAMVTVEDTIAPEAFASDLTVQLDAQGQASIVPQDIGAEGDDNCSVAFSVTPDTFSCGDVETPVTVTLTATDPSGNTGTATAVVTVTDEIAPTALAQDITVQLDANGEAYFTAGDVDAGSSDNCGVSLSVEPDMATCGNLVQPDKAGSVPVVLTVTDPSGNTATADATVSVEDNIAPTAVAQDLTVQLDENGLAGITAEEVDNGSSDNCSFLLDVAPSAFTCADTETPVTVTLTVTDNSGNTAAATAQVTVLDTIPPVANASQSTSLMFNLDENGQFILAPEDIDEGSSDNCSVALSVSPDTFTCDDVGDLIWVTLTVTDPSGNTATGQSMIMVFDSLAPTAIAQDVTVQLDENGQGSITAEEVDNGSTDNCAVILSVEPNAFTCDDLVFPEKGAKAASPVPVVLTVSDGNFNTSTASALAWVVDSIPPVITLNGESVVVLSCGESYVEQAASGTDNCDGETYVELDNSAVDVNVAGNYEVTYDSTDMSGNAAETVIRTVVVVGDCPDCLDSDMPPNTPAVCFGFESDLEGFVLDNQPGNVNLWHRSDLCPGLTVPNGPSFVLYFGDDDDCTYDVSPSVSEGTATSPNIDLTASTGPVLLVFDYFVETLQFSYDDIAAVEITDDGTNYSELASNYIESWELFCDDGLDIPQGKKTAEANNNDSKDQPPIWRIAVLDLSSFAGSVVNIRFTFNTFDTSDNDATGFAVDNVCVYDYSPAK